MHHSWYICSTSQASAPHQLYDSSINVKSAHSFHSSRRVRPSTAQYKVFNHTCGLRVCVYICVCERDKHGTWKTNIHAQVSGEVYDERFFKHGYVGGCIIRFLIMHRTCICTCAAVCVCVCVSVSQKIAF